MARSAHFDRVVATRASSRRAVLRLAALVVVRGSEEAARWLLVGTVSEGAAGQGSDLGSLGRVTVDPLVSLASCVHAGPGMYALLLGSGISRSAGVPTGSELTEKLAARLATAHGEDAGSNPIAWYQRWSDGDPEYSKLLESFARSPEDRRNLLREYFEPSGEDRNEGRKIPSAAHRAVAGLVAKGFVRVIVTTNFDRLMEQALRDAGVDPEVIATPAAADRALPLAHSDATVIKVHGDYPSPDLKNTVAELGTYAPAMNRLLAQVFDEYGLVVCGWSAASDRALRDAIERAESRRFGWYWLHRSPVGELVLCPQTFARVC